MVLGGGSADAAGRTPMPVGRLGVVSETWFSGDAGTITGLATARLFAWTVPKERVVPEARLTFALELTAIKVGCGA